MSEIRQTWFPRRREWCDRVELEDAPEWPAGMRVIIVGGRWAETGDPHADLDFSVWIGVQYDGNPRRQMFGYSPETHVMHPYGSAPEWLREIVDRMRAGGPSL